MPLTALLKGVVSELLYELWPLSFFLVSMDKSFNLEGHFRDKSLAVVSANTVSRFGMASARWVNLEVKARTEDPQK